MNNNMDKETQDFIVGLIEKALDGKHPEFPFCRTYNAYLATKTYIRGAKKIVKCFKAMADDYFNQYLEASASGEDNLDLLMKATQMMKCGMFYKMEASYAQDTIVEYQDYLVFHPVSALLGVRRTDADIESSYLRYKKHNWRTGNYDYFKNKGEN